MKSGRINTLGGITYKNDTEQVTSTKTESFGPYSPSASNLQSGTLDQWIPFLLAQLQAITGEVNYYDQPTYNLIEVVSLIGGGGVISSYATSIGDGTSTSFNINHLLGTRDVVVQLYRNDDYLAVDAEVIRATPDSIIINVSTILTPSECRVVVLR